MSGNGLLIAPNALTHMVNLLPFLSYNAGFRACGVASSSAIKNLEFHNLNVTSNGLVVSYGQ